MASGNAPLNPFSRGDVLAQTGAEASMFDALAIDSLGVPESVLMENAGRSAALVVQYLYSCKLVKLVCVSCEPPFQMMVFFNTFKYRN